MPRYTTLTSACSGCTGRLTRRAFVRAGAVAVVGGLAGCGGAGSASTPDPIALSGRKQCDVCGMVIEDHPGPTGQIFFEDNSPADHENPAWFDALTELFSYRFEKTDLGWTPAATYVTDYSAVDYEIDRQDGTAYIESFVAADTFAAADGLDYVAGSPINGAMGPDLIPFSEPAEAEAFAAEHGGEVVAYDAIDRALVARAMRA